MRIINLVETISVKYGILSYIADCPDVFDSMTKPEMAV